jgi:hypothetical protein
MEYGHNLAKDGRSSTKIHHQPGKQSYYSFNKLYQAELATSLLDMTMVRLSNSPTTDSLPRKMHLRTSLAHKKRLSSLPPLEVLPANSTKMLAASNLEMTIILALMLSLSPLSCRPPLSRSRPRRLEMLAVSKLQ